MTPTPTPTPTPTAALRADLVRSEVQDGVALLTFNRPAHKNTWTLDMEARYFELLDECAANPDVRVIVVTGADRWFCPGLDSARLVGVADGLDTKPAERRPMTHATTIPKPVIAAVNGACAGIGLVQALACDLRFASARARLSTAFVRRGIMAEHGIAWLLPRVVGWGNAMDLLLSGRVLDADEAQRMGLVNRIFEPDQLLPETLSYANELATWSSPLAMATMKDQLFTAQAQTLDEARLDAIARWNGTLKQHPDFKEGAQSMVERRTPRFEPWRS